MTNIKIFNAIITIKANQINTIYFNIHNEAGDMKK